MPIPEHLKGVTGDECICGRRLSVRHCPSCGSARIYGYATLQWHRSVRGEMEQVQLYRCLACAHRFTDVERFDHCEASPVTTALAKQKIKALHEARKTGEPLTDTEKKLVDALEQVAPNEFKPVEITDAQLKQLWTEIRQSWAREKLKSTLNNFPNIFDYLRKALEDLKIPNDRIEQVIQWHNELLTFQMEPPQ